MNSLPHPADKRITELLDLEQEEGQPLALRPETIILLEDAGWVVEPFTAQLWRGPARTAPTVNDLMLSTFASLSHLFGNADHGA